MRRRQHHQRRWLLERLQDVEDGYQCRVAGKPCTPKCGDGKILGSETVRRRQHRERRWLLQHLPDRARRRLSDAGTALHQGQVWQREVEKSELCDCGTDPNNLPSGCKAVNGLFYGDGKGCSKTCTKEPSCQDSSRQDPGLHLDLRRRKPRSRRRLRRRQPGGRRWLFVEVQGRGWLHLHDRDRPGLHRRASRAPASASNCPSSTVTSSRKTSRPAATRTSSSWARAIDGSIATTICVPNSGGPSKGNDSTARCWGIVAANLLNGKPQPGYHDDLRLPVQRLEHRQRQPHPRRLYPGRQRQSAFQRDRRLFGRDCRHGCHRDRHAGVSPAHLSGYTSSTPGGPIWKGTTPAYKNAASFKQWFNDDTTVNKTFTGVLEMTSIGSKCLPVRQQVASRWPGQWFLPPRHAESQPGHPVRPVALLEPCNGIPIWATCTRRPILLPAARGPGGLPEPESAEQWLLGHQHSPGVKHDNYFTDEARYYFVYDGATGISLSFFGDDDLFIFINGVLVLDLGGVHQQLPGKVTVTRQPGRCQRHGRWLPRRGRKHHRGHRGLSRLFAHQHHPPASDGQRRG